MTEEAPSQTRPLTRFDWEKVVRRVDLPLSTKGVALLLATYADDKGRNARPGEERLSRVTGINVRNTRRHVAKLRDMGLITRVSRSNRLRGLADVYRLTVPTDLAVLGPLLDPESEMPIPVDNHGHRSPETGTNEEAAGHTRPVEGSEEGASPVAGDATTGHTATVSPVTSDPPPTMYQPHTNHEESSSQVSTSPGRVAGAVDGHGSSAQLASLAAEECDGGHGGAPGRLPNGDPRCAQCRRGRFQILEGGKTA